MAAESTRKILVSVLKISTSLKCIPYEWDKGEGKLKSIQSSKKLWLAYLNAFIQCFYGLFIGVTLIIRLASLESEKDIVVHELLLHGIYTISFVSPAIYTLNMVLRPTVFQEFVNSFLNFYGNHEALLVRGNEYHGENKYLNFLLLSFARGTIFNVTMLACLFLENPMRPHYLFSHTGFSQTSLPMVAFFTIYECCMGLNAVISFFVILFFMLCHLDAVKFWLHQITSNPQNIRLGQSQTMTSVAANTHCKSEKLQLPFESSTISGDTEIHRSVDFSRRLLQQYPPKRVAIKNSLTVKMFVASRLQVEDMRNLQVRMQFHVYRCLHMLNNQCNEVYRDVVLVVFVSACFLGFVCSAYTTIRTFETTTMPAYLIGPGLWCLCLNLQLIFQSSAGDIYQRSKRFKSSLYAKASRRNYVRKRLNSVIPLKIFIGYYYFLQKKTLLLFLMLASTQTMSVLIAC